MTHPGLIRLADNGYLDAVLEIGFGMDLWTIQRRIVRAISKPNAKVAVPSCNASGKTAVAGAISLAFYSVYDDAKVVTTSAREDQLRDNLWGEIRRFYDQRTIDFPGNVPISGMSVRDGRRLLVGLSPARPEGIKGFHSTHLLVVVDEASYLDEEMAAALQTLLASGDARLLIIFNPTDSNSWAADVTETGGFEVIPIPAWDTPYLAQLTNEQIYERWGVELPSDRTTRIEPIPRGASLITPEYLDSLIESGRGPGTYAWETSVEAKFWSIGLDALVPRAMYDLARVGEASDGAHIFGLDLAAYGDSESVVAIRRGNELVKLEARSGIRNDHFWVDVVKPLVDSYDPKYVVWDADGPGAGSYTDAQAACGGRALPFRGSLPLPVDYVNMRSRDYWNLRTRFEWSDIHIGIDDPVLRRQLTSITFERKSGKIAVEQKQHLRRRGIRNIDRADAVMYAFSTEPPVQRAKPVDEETLRMRDASEDLFYERLERKIKSRTLPRHRGLARLR